MKFKFFNSEHNCKDYIIASYWLESKTSLRDAAWALATGQSIGNPSIRSVWESEELYERSAVVVLNDEATLMNVREGVVRFAFPVANLDIDTDGVSQLLCHLMGGQLDIDNIVRCRLFNVLLPTEMSRRFRGPKYGIHGIRSFTNTHNKPLLGGIVKPKVGINSDTLLDITKELVEGGVNFIKEDEIMASPLSCRLEERLPKIVRYLEGKDVVYCFCINSDPPYVLDRARFVAQNGGNGVHVNFWSGMGTYKAIRDLDLPLFIHFQKSGDKILTDPSHRFSIAWNVICDLAGLMGVDFIHAGMWGGYSEICDKQEMDEMLGILRNRRVLPALSCGMHPGLVEDTVQNFGVDLLLNVGGAIHGHPGGTKAGTQAMRQAIDRTGGKEFDEAIAKWGKR